MLEFKMLKNFIYLFLSSVIVCCDAEHKRTTEFEAALLLYTLTIFFYSKILATL